MCEKAPAPALCLDRNLRRECINILSVADERFRKFTTAFHPAKLVHFFMKFVKTCFRVLADMSEARCPLAIRRLSNINVVRRVKDLCLSALIDFVIVKSEFPPRRQPGVVYQPGCRSVIPVTVNRPVGEYKIRMFAFQDFPKVCVSGSIHFRVAVDLAGEPGPRL